ncbi:MAG: flagellar protein FliT [Ectothiorhodospiraceae bacterium]|nr:flagellar protein FliT [Ectothiorhodospiraceae bacterium]
MAARDADPVLQRKQMARRLLGLTEQMLRAARSGDWTAVGEFETQRQQAARDLFATPVPEDAASTVEYCVSRVLELDPELLRLVSQAREAAGVDVQNLRAGRRAVDQYARFSR